MEIIPLEDQLLIEAYINPRDVAYVRTGMPALVKLTAYDYAIYGGLDGVVTLVSPDTLRDQKRTGRFKNWIQMKHIIEYWLLPVIII